MLRWSPIFLGLLLLPALSTCRAGNEAIGESSEPRLNSRENIEQLPRWSLADDPDLSIGVMEGAGPDQFGSVRAGVLGPHGVYVLDGLNREVRVFDRSGGHIISLGGQGKGPGEFLNPTGLLVNADSTVCVWDRSLRRLTVFGHGGTLVRVASVHRRLANPNLHAVLADGSFFLSEYGLVPQRDVEVTRTLTLSLFSTDGDFVSTIASLSGGTQSAVGRIAKPFTSPDHIAGAGDGVWVMNADTALLVLVRSPGDTVRTISWEPPNRQVTDADLDSYEASLGEWLGNERHLREIEKHLRDPGFASERHPAAVQLFSDGIGRIWLVERHDWDRIQSPTWLIFDTGGRAIARLTEPLETLDILDADRTHALVRTTGPFGTPRIQLRRIVASVGGGR